MSSEVICGVNAVLEALRAGTRHVHEVFIASGKRPKTATKIIEEAQRKAVPVRDVSRDRIRELSRIEKHQGVAARVDPFIYEEVEVLAKNAREDSSEGFIVMLDDIIDPQNVGSIIRSAHLTGAAGVIIPKDRSASIGPAATRASAGATEYCPIARVTNCANTLETLKEQGFWVVGAAGEGAQSLYSYDFAGHPHVIVLGGEGAGMRRLVREKCDALLSIPMRGEVESYNVAVAGAIFLAEASRQTWVKKSCKSHTF